jgi:hypothetical protein
MKIDVEGFEARVLEGASTTLANPGLKAVIMETNGSGSRYGIQDVDLHERLTALGFVACNYGPFSRMIEVTSAPNTEGNTIYVRDLDFASERVADAPTFAVAGSRVI